MSLGLSELRSSKVIAAPVLQRRLSNSWHLDNDKINTNWEIYLVQRFFHLAHYFLLPLCQKQTAAVTKCLVKLLNRTDSSLTKTMWSLDTQICLNKLAYNWFKKLLVACSVPSHRLNQRWLSVDWIRRTYHLWDLKKKKKKHTFSSNIKHAVWYAVSKMSVILGLNYCAKLSRHEQYTMNGNMAIGRWESPQPYSDDETVTMWWISIPMHIFHSTLIVE